MKVRQIYCDLYTCTIIIVVNCKHDGFNRYLKRVGAREYTFTDRHVGLSENFEGGEHHGKFFFWIADPNDQIDYVHELAHLTFNILQDKGIKADCHNQEAFCYLQGWLMEKITEALR
jgi:hypothetical protein